MNWHNVSKKEPCPICHKTDWCNLSDDGAVCICHRVESPYLARSGSGWIHRLIDRPVNHFTRRPTCCRTLAVPKPTDPTCCRTLAVPHPTAPQSPVPNPHSPTTYLPVGRSSCQTGSAHLRALIRRVRPRIITIVADNDAPGIKGAELLAQQLISHPSSPIPHPYYAVRVLVVPHPYKDLRAWYLSNTLTPRLFADLTSAQRWR